ncbi:MAG: sulfatase, partial [Phycisphaerales bacterium]
GAIRQGNYKFIEFYEDGRLELYDLANDIGEKENLATVMPQRAAQLQQKLAKWRRSVNAEMPTANPDYDPARANEWKRRPQR